MSIALFSTSGFLICLSLALTVCACLVRAKRAIHMLQLDSYSNSRLLRWYALQPLNRLLDWRSACCFIGILLAFLIGDHLKIEYALSIALVCWLSVLTGWLLINRRPIPEKKPLVFTARAIRISVAAVFICCALAAGIGILSFGLGRRSGVSGLFMGQLLLLELSPVLVVCGNIVLIPVQKAVNNHYLSQAARRLREWHPIVVAVAGSFGKTSTKYFIETLLKEKYRVLKTPQSYNTLMGICRVINGDLNADHEVFVVEIGAYRRGDVKEIADFVKPRIGVLTSIGPEHLERFKTIENVEATNYELIESLPPEGMAAFNFSDPRCRRLAERTRSVRVLRFGIAPEPGLRVWAEDISLGPEGTSFVLAGEDGRRVSTRTSLLGEHSIVNLLGAACIALDLGLSLDEVARAVPKIVAAPHRLELIRGSGGVVVIDDSYNSNPAGAMEALNVLSRFDGGKKVLVTPGMIELGTIHDQENERLGAHAAKVCDYVILVGPSQTRPIAKGLQRERFPENRTIVVSNLQQATAELGRIVRCGDVVLFENDLPDLYSEN